MGYITIDPYGKKAVLERGKTLLHYFQILQVNINAFCGGKGICRSCIVKVDRPENLSPMTVEEIKNVHEALQNAGMRDKVKIIVGGAPLNMDLAKKLGADDFAEDAVEGVRHIKALAKVTVDVKG